MAADRIVAASETYMGLSEVGVGILPAGGGTKEMVRRVVSPAARIDNPGIDKYIQDVSLTIAMAKIATSAAQAQDMGFLTTSQNCIAYVVDPVHMLWRSRNTKRSAAMPAYCLAGFLFYGFIQIDRIIMD